MPKALPTPDEYSAHAHALADAFGVVLLELSALNVDDSFCVGHVCYIRPIEGEIEYIVALHEIGHTAHPTGRLRDARTVDNRALQVVEEESAWQWAEHYALIWTDAMQHVKELTLQSYKDAHLPTARSARPVQPRESFSDFVKRIR